MANENDTNDTSIPHTLTISDLPPMPDCPPPPPPSFPVDDEVPDVSPIEMADDDRQTSVRLEDALGRLGVYSGETIVDTSSGNILPHGSHGIMLYDDKEESITISKNMQALLVLKPIKYEGSWMLGHWHGHGRVTYNTGDVYVGEWTTSLKNGRGIYTWSDGRQYNGMYEYDFRHGAGKYIWPGPKTDDGQPLVITYSGNFVKNQRSGFGTYVDEASGIEYSGEWKDGIYNGYGIYQWLGTPDLENCSQKGRRHAYRGNFRNGKPDGQGVEVLPNGSIRHEGLWKDGDPVLTDEQQEEHIDQIKNMNSAKTAVVAGITGRRKQNSLHSSSSAILDPTITQQKQKQHIVTSAETGHSSPDKSPKKATAPITITVVQNQSWKDVTTGCMCVYRGLWNSVNQYPDGNGTAVYKSGAVKTYEGCFKAGLYHGQGRLWYRNGDMYEGMFIAGQRHTDRDPVTGKVTIALYRWKDGRQYTGQFHANARQGRGTLVYANQDLYEGDFVAGQREGHGRFIFASDGSCYTGEWHAGQYHGLGTLVHGNGHMYTGQFQAGLEHGLGKLVDEAGVTIYDGEWVLGKRKDEIEAAIALLKEDAERKKNGAKMALNASTSSSADVKQQYIPPTASSSSMLRMWEDKPPVVNTLKSSNAVSADSANHVENEEVDNRPCEAVVNESVTDLLGCPGYYTGIVDSVSRLPHGVGRLVYADAKRIHEGFWYEGSKHGHGRCLFFPQGDFHEGEYVNNLRHGPGKYQWKDGRRFSGSYENDLRHGLGVFEYPSGERYEGNFERGQRCGFGRFDFVDKDNGNKPGYYEGLWKESRYHGAGHIVWGNGTSYSGEFVSGYPHGRGVKKDINGNILFDGTWVRGIPSEGSNLRVLEGNAISNISRDSEDAVLERNEIIEPEEKKDDDINCNQSNSTQEVDPSKSIDQSDLERTSVNSINSPSSQLQALTLNSKLKSDEYQSNTSEHFPMQQSEALLVD